MILCVCHNISENDFRKEVRKGISNLGQACARMELGTRCGKCCCDAQQIIKEELGNLKAVNR
jgi:bacterioferritin-associated ferredoxin